MLPYRSVVRGRTTRLSIVGLAGHAIAALALQVAAGCTGDIGDRPARPRRTVEAACEPTQLGAPVPMRRLTAEQVQRTVGDALDLGLENPPSVPDERLFTYRSNISSAIDVTQARGYLDFAEATAALADVTRCAAAPCTAWLLDELGLRLFRRPLSIDERTRYTALYQQGARIGGGEEGARWVIQAFLQSPTFLYLDEATEDDGLLDDHALASRLAFTLWGSAPDRALLDAAQRGELSTIEQVRAEAERMLEDPRSADGVADFVDQWLELHRLDSESARPDVAALGPEVVRALRDEPAAFFRSVIATGGGLRELLTTSETPAFAELDAIYGEDAMGQVEGPGGAITRLDPTRRAGILTLPGVQAALSHAEATSPTLRGYAVLAGFLCTPPGPPPAGVSVTLPPPVPGATTRQRLELHFSNATCGACHRSMDGIGFAFESYDWLGRSRDTEAGRPIDDTGTFVLGGDEVSIDGAIDLADEMAATREVGSCLARQWAQYASGVPATRDTACLVDSMRGELGGEGGLREMILYYVTSDWFRRGGETR